VVDVVDVEAAQLTHPHPRGVEQLEHRQVTQPEGTVAERPLRGGVEEEADLVLPERGRKGAVCLRGAERRSRVVRDPAGSGQPRREPASSRGAARDRRPAPATGLLLCQPAAEVTQPDGRELGVTEGDAVLEQRGEIADVRPDGVQAEVPLHGEVALVVGERGAQLRRERLDRQLLGTAHDQQG
jgi:hypothetical protein